MNDLVDRLAVEASHDPRPSTPAPSSVARSKAPSSVDDGRHERPVTRVPGDVLVHLRRARDHVDRHYAEPLDLEVDGARRRG